MDKRYTVFVSSTYKDLVDARWAVARALMRLNLIPLGMEAFTASDKSQWEIIKKTIDLSDYYVLILGNCYGSVDPETDISYTEKEYRYAVEQGIPCLTFISKDVPLRPEHRESDSHVKRLDALRAEVSAGRMVDFWTNADDLTGKVATALVMAQIETPRPGWVRNPQTSPEVAEELARLSRENAEMNLKIASNQRFTELDVINALRESKFSHESEASSVIDVFTKISGRLLESKLSETQIYELLDYTLGLYESQAMVDRARSTLLSYDLIRTDVQHTISGTVIGRAWSITEYGRRVVSTLAILKHREVT